MAGMTQDKRARITALALDTMRALDPTGGNAARYEKLLAGMTDDQFASFARRMRDEEDFHFYLEAVPYKNEPTLDGIERAAKVVGAALHDYVYFRHDGATVRSREKVPVGYVYTRRLQQLLKKKTGYALDTNKRSQVNGQLTGSSAAGRLSPAEAYALAAMGAEKVAEELMGPRADNRDKRLAMYQAIDRDGYVKMDELVGNRESQPTLNLLDSLLLAAGLQSDLVRATPLLAITAEKAARK